MRKPSVFGKYILLERLNVGGMAEVFLAKAFGVEGFEKTLAIKKILPTMAEDDEFITMFIDEARISVQLNHANIVHIHELGKHDESYFIAMEYVPGKDLRAIQERFHRRGELMPTAMAAYIAAKMCEGLDYAHRKKDARGQPLNIIHRDVSPQNILLSYEGELKIIDFGIAKAANRSQKTQAGILKGKFGYMSPEQVRGMPIDRRSDIFAVGVILYEMLTGEKLFVGESDFSTLEKVRNAEVPAPKQFNPNLPAGMEKVLLKALAREPEDRYQWGSDLQEDLMKFLVSGDSIYSTKHLGAFMREAFAEDVLREAEKMERFAQVERPDDDAGPKRKATPQSATARRSLSNIAPVHDDADTVSPSKADRTMIVDSSTVAPADPADSTMIGVSSLVTSGGGANTPRKAPTRQQMKAAEAADATIAPQSRRSALSDGTLPPRGAQTADDSEADLKPLVMTGFSPALETEEDANATMVPQSRSGGARPRIVIGDAPVNGSTTIGPSPLSHTAAEEEEERSSSTSENDAYDGDEAQGDDELYDEQEDLTGKHGGADDDDQTGVATGRAPALRGAGATPTKGRSRALLFGIVGLAALLLVGVAAAAAFLTGSRKPRFQVVPDPKMAFTLKVTPAGGRGPTRTYADLTKPVEAEPGEYLLVAIPGDDSYEGIEGKIQLKAGASTPLPVTIKFVKKATPAVVPHDDPKPVEPVATGDAGLEAKPDVKPELKTYAATFSSSEPDVDVFIDDKWVAKTPDGALKGLAVDRVYKGKARKKGFQDYEFELRNPDRRELVAVTLALEPLKVEKKIEPVAPPEKKPDPVVRVESSKPEPRPEVKPVVKPEPVKDPPKKDPVVVEKKPEPKPEPPKKDPKVVASKASGALACAAQPAVAAEVWVDGKSTGKTTPVIKAKAIPLPVGTHKLQLKVNGKLSPAQAFDVVENETVVVKVDVSAL